MPFIAPELIIQAKQMDLLTYLKNYEPYELVKFSGNTYCTRTHDSLKISNGKWIWWSRGIGCRSALDYLIKVKGYSFLEAVETIIGHTAIQAPVYEKPQPKEENKPLLLPEKCASNRVITEYLFGRSCLPRKTQKIDTQNTKFVLIQLKKQQAPKTKNTEFKAV